jgi:hypothetical protein
MSLLAESLDISLTSVLFLGAIVLGAFFYEVGALRGVYGRRPTVSEVVRYLVKYSPHRWFFLVAFGLFWVWFPVHVFCECV